MNETAQAQPKPNAADDIMLIMNTARQVNAPAAHHEAVLGAFQRLRPIIEAAVQQQAVPEAAPAPKKK